MSVIVKNMEMPERCGRCFFVRWSNLHQTAWCTLAQEACFEDFSRDYKNRRADFCPLVEIPTPHGRLIDKDKLRHELFVNFNGERIPFYDCDNFPTKIAYRDLHSILAEQKTVIEAEGSDT